MRERAALVGATLRGRVGARQGHVHLPAASGATSGGADRTWGAGMIRVLLADDHETVREGLRLLVDAQADMQVVGEAADGERRARPGRARWRPTWSCSI